MKKPTYDNFMKMAKDEGVGDVSQEEYDAHVSEKWSPKTALRRIGNARQKAEDDANKTIEIWEGYPLGGREFIHKKKGTDSFIRVEDARSQKIPFLRVDGTIVELNQWSEFKGKHGRKSEVEVEITEREGKDRVFIDNTVRAITVRDQKVSIQKLLGVAVSVDELREDDKYQYVVIHGQVGRFDTEPRWENGEKVDTYPINYNKVPCLNFALKGPENKVYCRCQLAPTKYAVPHIALEDFDAMKDTSIEEFDISFQGRKVIVVGWLRRYDPQADVIYANLMTTAIFAADSIPMDAPKPTPAPAPEQPTIESAASKPSTSAAEMLKKVKGLVDEAYDVIGDDLDLASFKELNSNMDVSDKIIEAVIKKKKAA